MPTPLDYVLTREGNGYRWYRTCNGETNNVNQAKTFTGWEPAAKAAEGTRYQYCQVQDLLNNRYEVRYSKGGFGDMYRPWSKRPYAIRDTFAQTWVRTKGGPIKTFASREAAEGEIVKLVAEQAAQPTGR